MSISVAVDSVSIDDGIPPSSIECPTSADLGQEAFGGFDVEDPAATLTIIGHRPVTVTESDCAQPRLSTGWTTQRGIGRDREAGMIVAGQRQHDVTTVDLNALFNFRLISGSDGNRPQETWDARLAWILSSDYLAGLIADTGYIASRATVIMDAADYRKDVPGAVLADLQSRLTGEVFNYFAFWDVTASTVGLFFDDENNTIGDCPLTISNVLADVNRVTCFDPNSTAKLTREPDQTYSEVIVTYGHGSASVFRSRASTAAAFIRRGTTIDRPYTGKLATATAQAEGFLSMHASERDRLTCSIQVPPESAGLIYAGQRISVKFSHMPGYTTWTWMRITACDVKPTTDVANLYDVGLELLGTRQVGGGTPFTCASVITTAETAITHVLDPAGAYPVPVVVTASVDITPTLDGPLLLFGWCVGENQDYDFAKNMGTIAGYTTLHSSDWSRGTFTIGYRQLATVSGAYTAAADYDNSLAGGPGRSIWAAAQIALNTSAAAPVQEVSANSFHADLPGTPTAGNIILMLFQTDGSESAVADDPDSSWVELFRFEDHKATTGLAMAAFARCVAGGAGTHYGVTLGGYSTSHYISLSEWAIAGTGNDDTVVDIGPVAGTTITGETPTPAPDGTTVLFTTAHSYRAGSLAVVIDGIPIPPSQVTETDPAAGTFTLSWAPDADETIVVSYVRG